MKNWKDVGMFFNKVLAYRLKKLVRRELPCLIGCRIHKRLSSKSAQTHVVEADLSILSIMVNSGNIIKQQKLS